MAVEIVESNLVIVDNGNDENETVDNEKLSIMFGSHGVDEPAKVEINNVSESNLPKDAVDEWPEPQQIHSFYVVRYRALEDQNLKAKLDLAEKELQKKNQARLQIVEKIRAKRVSRGILYFGHSVLPCITCSSDNDLEVSAFLLLMLLNVSFREIEPR